MPLSISESPIDDAAAIICTVRQLTLVLKKMTFHQNDTPPDTKNFLYVGSIGKAFCVLETLKQAARPVALTELAQLADMNRSVVQRITHTLKALGYLRQHPDTRAYTLSSRLLEFGHTVLAMDRLREKAHPYLEALNRRTHETVNLMKLEDNEIVYIARFPSLHAVSVDLHVGSRLPAFCTAAGRAILSRLDQTTAHEHLAQATRTPMTQYTITELPGLEKALADALRLGYALNNQEAFIGDISVAAPLIDRQGNPIGAVNIAVPSPRWRLNDVRHSLAPQVLATAYSINSELRDL